MFSICWIFDGDRTLLTDSHAVIMRSFPVSIPDFFNRALRLLMLFCKTGILRTTGFSLQFRRLRGLLLIWECVKRRGHLLFLCESLRIFGRCYVTMVDIGTHLLTIGLYFSNLSNFLWEAKPRMACLAQESCPSQLSLCALVSSYLRGFLYQAFVLMTVAVAPSVDYFRVFCTH